MQSAIVGSVVFVSVILSRSSVIILNVYMLNNVLLGVEATCHYEKIDYAECYKIPNLVILNDIVIDFVLEVVVIYDMSFCSHCAKCNCAECHKVVCHYV